MKNCVNLYLKAVGKELICKWRYKRALLKQLSDDIDCYLEANGEDVSISDLELKFGNPYEVAETFLKQTEYPTVKKRLSHKKAAIVIIALFCIAFVLGGVFALHIWREDVFFDGYLELTPTYQRAELSNEATTSKNVRLY